MTKASEVLHKQLLLQHHDACECFCSFCEHGACTKPLNSIPKLMKHVLCPPSKKFTFLDDEFYGHNCCGTYILTNLYIFFFFGLLSHSLCNVLLEMPVSFCKFADTTCMEPSCLFQNKATCFHCPISNLGSDQGTIKWEKHVKTDITRANYTAPTPTLGRIKLAGPPPKRYFKKVLSIYVHDIFSDTTHVLHTY